MKKWFIALAMLITLALCCPVAMAGNLSLNAMPYSLDSIETYSGFSLDESTGEWSLSSNQALAMLDEVQTGALKGYSSKGNCFFELSVSGNEKSGWLQPMLTLYFVGSNRMEPSAVSFLVDGTRYDLAVFSEEAAIGEQTVERMQAPLDMEGLALMEKLTQAEEVKLRLHGNKTYSTTLKAKVSSSANARTQVESASLKTLEPILAALDTLNISEYDRWAENAEIWEQKTNQKPMLTQTVVADQTVQENAPKLTSGWGMLTVGDSGSSVRSLQKSLGQEGYLVDFDGSRYDKLTRKAVMRYQQLNGLLPTGSADQQTVNLLFGAMPETQASEPEASTERIALAAGENLAQGDLIYEAKDVAAISLEQCELARQVSPSGAIDAAGAVGVTNSDNLLFIARGTIQNLGSEELNFYFQLPATLIYDGKYSFTCTLQCEADGGSRFETSILPMAQADLVVTAEIPEALLNQTGDWSLSFTLGESQLVYPIDR